MNGSRWTVVAALLVLGSVAGAQGTAPVKVPGAAPQKAPARSPAEQFALTRGRALMLEFYAVKLENLWGAFTPDVREQWGEFASFRAFRELGVRQYGAELKLLDERTFTRDGESFYVRSATFQKAPKQVWALIIGFRNLRVTSFGIAPQSGPPPEDQVAWRAGSDRSP